MHCVEGDGDGGKLSIGDEICNLTDHIVVPFIRKHLKMVLFILWEYWEQRSQLCLRCENIERFCFVFELRFYYIAQTGSSF